MLIARELKEKNIAEYLIYMWQVEDMIRAANFNIEKIKLTIIPGFRVGKKEELKLIQWYDELILMMREEGVEEQGHLQINENVLLGLTDLHLELLRSSKFPYYGVAYFKALPFIVELRAKSGKKDEPELKTCFEVLYGVLLLKLQKKEISVDTGKAIGEISKLLSLLANYYDKYKKGELKLDN